MDWLQYIFNYGAATLLIICAVIFPIIAFWWIIQISLRVEAGAVIVAVGFVISTFFISAPSVSLGLNLSTDDLVFALLMTAIFVRLICTGMFQVWVVHRIWLAIGIVLFVSLGIGLLQYGSKAGVEVRANFYFWMAGCYFSFFSYPSDVLKKLWRITKWTSWFTVGIVCYRLIGLKLGFVSLKSVELAGAGSEFRVIGSGPTFFLAVVAITYFIFWLRKGGRQVLTSALFLFGLVFVLQHRSVWVSVIGAMMIVLWAEKKALVGKRILLVGISSVLITLILALMFLSGGNRLADTVTESATSVMDSKGTHVDRILGWQALLKDFAQAGPMEWLIGEPYGTGYSRWINGKFETFSPHNFYVQILLRLGAVGLILFLWLHFILYKRIFSQMKYTEQVPLIYIASIATLAASLLYYIPYQGFYLQGVFYGMIIGYLNPASIPRQIVPLNIQHISVRYP